MSNRVMDSGFHSWRNCSQERKPDIVLTLSLLSPLHSQSLLMLLPIWEILFLYFSSQSAVACTSSSG